jgi:hypothetical protein
LLSLFITLFKPIEVLCGTGNIMWNISHIQVECEEYFSHNIVNPT